MINRPSFISKIDFDLLQKKYKSEYLLKRIIKKIEKNYPIQYAIGNVDFLSLNFIVNKYVLIPRFETELLTKKLITYIKKNNLYRSDILDLCTGSGCIGLSLKNEFKSSEVTLVDKSLSALTVAFRNASKYDLDVCIAKMDVLKKLKFKNKYSILVSNPPYVKLDEEVTENTKYEPKMALYPGKDDIIFYKKILDNAKNILYPKNIIAFEIGSTQSQEICKYAKKIFPKAKIVVEKDYNQYDRFIFILNNCE